VLESQSRALTSQSDLLSARRLLLENRVDLYLALGGGFEYSGFDETSEEDESSGSVALEAAAGDPSS
jgi:hypothetical protein